MKEINMNLTFNRLKVVKNLPNYLVNMAMTINMVSWLIGRRVMAIYELDPTNYTLFVRLLRVLAACEIRDRFESHSGDEAQAVLQAYYENLPELIEEWMDQNSEALDDILANYDFTEFDKCIPKIFEAWKIALDIDDLGDSESVD